MKRVPALLWLCVLVVIALGSIGCGSSHTRVRFVDASPDETSLSLLVDGKVVADSVSYSTASSYVSVTPGSRHLQVETPGSSTILIDQTPTFSASTDTTVMAGSYSSSIAGLMFVDDNSAPTSGNMKLRIINASPGLGTADVYIVAPGTDLTTVSPTVSGLAFEVASTYQSLPAGSYEIFFTLPGQKFTYIDSGALSFSAGQVRTVLGLNGASGGFTSAVLADVN